MLEVELRYRLHPEEIIQVTALLQAAGIFFAIEESQKDIYYTSKHKDFIGSQECLRIRNVNDRAEITWKPPSTDTMRAAPEFWKEEVDLPIGDKLQAARKLLSALDFIEYVVVLKSRKLFRSADGLEVSIDQVHGAGTFIEIEMKTDDVDAGKKAIHSLARKLNLKSDMLCTTPYRDLVPKR